MMLAEIPCAVVVVGPAVTQDVLSPGVGDDDGPRLHDVRLQVAPVSDGGSDVIGGRGELAGIEKKRGVKSLLLTLPPFISVLVNYKDLTPFFFDPLLLRLTPFFFVAVHVAEPVFWTPHGG